MASICCCDMAEELETIDCGVAGAWERRPISLQHQSSIWDQGWYLNKTKYIYSHYIYIMGWSGTLQYKPF